MSTNHNCLDLEIVKLNVYLVNQVKLDLESSAEPICWFVEVDLGEFLKIYWLTYQRALGGLLDAEHLYT